MGVKKVASSAAGSGCLLVAGYTGIPMAFGVAVALWHRVRGTCDVNDQFILYLGGFVLLVFSLPSFLIGRLLVRAKSREADSKLGDPGEPQM